MIKKQVEQYILNKINEQNNVKELPLFKEEFQYVSEHKLLDEVTFIEIDSATRFANAYIERCNKETEELIKVENSSFLEHPIIYFKEHIDEFIYMECDSFDIIGVDAISFEMDDVFRTYDVMLGLKLQKKYEPSIKAFLNSHLTGEAPNYDLMFSQNDGLWDLNFDLNSIKGFTEEITINEAYCIVFTFIFNLLQYVEENK